MNTGVTFPKPASTLKTPVSRPCIHEMFGRQAMKSPSAVAVCCAGQKLTYSELDRKSNQLANHLRRLGVGPEVSVALYLERSLEMVVAILGVLKAGGAYVPIDLAYPVDRLSFMLEDTRAPILITQENLVSRLPQTAPKTIRIDSQWDEIEGESAEPPAVNVLAENAAYIIYTSGSTGKPKGVIVTHHNVVRLLQQTSAWYQFNAKDVWPLFHSYAFDVSVWELWGSLFNGGRLVVVPYLTTRNPAEFYGLLAREEVTVLNQTPSAFRQLIWAEQTVSKKLPLTLRYVICAGEALELQSLKPWFEIHGDEQPRIVNMYGITETTVHSTYRVIRQADLTSGVGSVIGVPIPDLQIHLLDENLKAVPAGTPGEICVGGAGVARGYLNRPDLTSKRFVPDPFSDVPGAVMYRSGDLAQVNPNGEMEYLGRMDHQVKIRGFRVELGEIESALNRHDSIRESVVIAQDTAVGDKRLVGYIVPDVEVPPSVTELREYLAPKIPDYMIPAVFVVLERLPLTTNGKVDRRALPTPDSARPDLREAYVPPGNDVERTMAGIWSDVLGIIKVGVNDNFFELGGDSIRSIRVLAKAQENGWRLSLEDIFRRPTVGGLVQCIKKAEDAPALKPTEPFSLIPAEDKVRLPGDAQDAYPISKLQLGMFYHNELDPVSAIYHDVFSYRIHSPFDREKLQQAVQDLAGRHPMLRTSFHLAGYSQPLQVVHQRVNVPFTFEDLKGLGPQDQDSLLVDWIEKEKRRPFDRTIPPLCRCHTQIRSESEFQFILSFHHCSLDGWSLAAVITEIFRDYAALLAGAGEPSEAPRITYRDFIALEQQTIRAEESRKFWTAKTADAPAALLPRWPKAMCAGGHEQKRGPEISIRPEILEKLKKLANSAGVPLKTVLLAGHQRVMSFLYGQNDIVTGLVGNGRPEALDGEKLIGLFLNTVPFRQLLTGGSWLQLVKDTFAAEQEVMPFRRMPLAEIQRLHGGQPLFETAFDFVHFHVYNDLQALRSLDLAEGHYFEANNLTTYTTLMLDVTSTRLEIHIDYDPNAIAAAQVEEMTAYYVAVFEAMASDPSARHESFSPLSPAERKRLLEEWNATESEYPRHHCIHEVVALRARENPHAVAIVCGSEKVTYAELMQRAEGFAAVLRRLGVSRESLVALCVERSCRMVVALLGILKAGGAYVPLDPVYPKERLAFMLRDSNAAVVVTERGLLPQLPETAAKVLYLDEAAATQAEEGAAASPGPDSLAYVIYTSGSTGEPKGVQVTHSNVLNLLTSAARTAGVTDADNLLAVTTLSFDIAGLELWMPLISGGTVTLATREVANDGIRLAGLIESSRATIMQATPATWRILIESGWRGCPNLKVFCGGEALKRSLADELLSRAKEVWNFYGPTETTIWSTAARVRREEPITIGRPLANTRLYILNGDMKPVPPGVIGELHIGGAGVARGYLNRPELTSQRFVPDPFAGDGSRLYKTGDLARYLPDGRVDCLGRLDHQVKVHGFRIEPGEIETALRQHKGIAEALVTASADALGESRLVGYVISRNGPPSAIELKEYLKSRLPAYMVPASFVVLKEFPLTPNGKIDVKKLPRPDAAPEGARPYLPPRNQEEHGLAEIWKEVLLLKQVGIDDNFFDLGGDSLSATRAFARANRAFGMELTLREMLERPTIRSLAELVATAKRTAPAPGMAIPRQPRRTRVTS